jgi:acyl carrier protein
MEELIRIFREVFEDDSIKLAPETSADDIETWDSFHHINVMLEIEEAFGVEFTTEEIVKSTKVGELVTILQSKGCDVAW